MLGHKELRERKEVVGKELKCGWPSEFEKRSNAFCVNCEKIVKSTCNARFPTPEISMLQIYLH